jgi:hypothetical protein
LRLFAAKIIRQNAGRGAKALELTAARNFLRNFSATATNAVRTAGFASAVVVTNEGNTAGFAGRNGSGSAISVQQPNMPVRMRLTFWMRCRYCFYIGIGCYVCATMVLRMSQFANSCLALQFASP